MVILNRLSLEIPKVNELYFRKELLADVETMSYNKGFAEFDGYNPMTGCINFNESGWNGWVDKWINNSERFYAYIIKVDESIPIGDVALYYDEREQGYCIHIVIHSKYRGNGYSKEALMLVLKVAFDELKAEKVFDNFPETRQVAEKLFFDLGFKRVSQEIVELKKSDFKDNILK